MIYIHSLKDLTPKTAEVESVQIVRAAKSNLKLSLSEENLSKLFKEYFINSDDFNSMEISLSMIDPAIEKIKELINGSDPEYESINLVRAIGMLEELKIPLEDNIQYLKEIESWQNELLSNILSIINYLPNAKTMEEKMKINSEINSIFKRILRNEEFIFNSNGIVNEGKFTRIKDLYKSLNEGFFFHFTVKEHIDKTDVDAVRRRIRSDILEKVDVITKDVSEIKKGVDKAYEYNMNMVKLTINFYSYIKLLIS